MQAFIRLRTMAAPIVELHRKVNALEKIQGKLYREKSQAFGQHVRQWHHILTGNNMVLVEVNVGG